MGFADDLESLLDATPGTRQTALFSATLPKRIQAIAQKYLTTPARITVTLEKPSAAKGPQVRQLAYVVSRAQKPMALQRVLDSENPTSALVSVAPGSKWTPSSRASMRTGTARKRCTAVCSNGSAMR